MSTWTVSVTRTFAFSVEADSFDEAMDEAMDTDYEDYPSAVKINLEKSNEQLPENY